MDEPIIYCPRSSAPYLILEPEYPEDEMFNAIKLDDKDEFLRLLDHPDMYYDKYLTHKLFGLYDVNCMLEHDALQIAMLFINGETKGYIKDDRLVFKDGWTPLHLACATSSLSPKLIKFFIQRGDPLDVPCDYPPLNLKQATPLDLLLEVIDNGYEYEYYQKKRPWTLRRSMFELLQYVCQLQRGCLEGIRLLVQNTENKERLRKAFIDSANEGKFIKVVALYLAAPELFLSTSLGGGSSTSSIDELYLNLNSLDKPTYIQDGLSLLLDVFHLVGHMLIAYVRLDDPKVWDILKTRICGFFLREVAHKKLGISSRDDYLLSLFKPVSQHAFEPPCLPPIEDGMKSYSRVSWDIYVFYESRKLDIDYLNRYGTSLFLYGELVSSRLVSYYSYLNSMFNGARTIPNLKPHEEDNFRKAIDNKLSIMPNICTLSKGTTRIPNKWVNERFLFPFRRSIQRSIELHMARSPTEAANVKNKYNPIPIQSRLMNLTKLEPFIAPLARSRITMIAKRLLK